MTGTFSATVIQYLRMVECLGHKTRKTIPGGMSIGVDNVTGH
ncbi:hypothetical protein ATHEMM101B_17590 [Atlantibacter hermannii]